MDHFLTISFFADKFKETFGLLGYYIHCLGHFFACFLFIKFNIDVVVVFLRGLEIPKVSGATFDFVRKMQGATFHLFVLSLQKPMYETDENKNNGNLCLQNVTGNESLAAAMYEKSPTSLYPHVHIVNNPMPICSNVSESLGKDPIVFHSSGNAPLNSFVSTQGSAPSISSAFWNNSIDGNTPNTSNNGNAPDSNGNAPIHHLKLFVTLQKRNSKN